MLTLSWLPAMLAVTIGGVQLAEAVHIDDDDGVNRDFAFERAWPAMMAAMRADPEETLKAAAALSRR